VSELLRKHEVVASPQSLAEVADVLSRWKVASAYHVNKYVALVGRLATTVTPQPLPGSVPEDPDDEVVLGTALQGRASHVVTGDEHLLNLGAFRGIRVVTVAELLDILPRRRSHRGKLREFSL
jgi:predicted nucleic acid-binding protein